MVEARWTGSRSRTVEALEERTLDAQVASAVKAGEGRGCRCVIRTRTVEARRRGRRSRTVEAPQERTMEAQATPAVEAAEGGSI